MIESFIITLREGIEAGLILGLILACLNSMGRNRLRASVYFGMVVAVVFSFLFAYLLGKFAVNEEAFEGITLWFSAILVSSMLVWMWRNAPKLKHTISVRLSNMTIEEGSVFHWGIFFFSFFILFREGVEMAVFLSAVQLTSKDMSSVLGGIAGLLVAAVFTFGIVKGSLHIDLRRFFVATTTVLCVFLIQVIIAGTHELAEVGWIPMTREWMHRLGPFIRHEYLFNIGIVLLPTLLLILPSRMVAVPAGASAADDRWFLYQKQWALYGKVLVGVLGFSSSIFVLAHAWSKPSLELSEPVRVSDFSGEVQIDLQTISEGNLYRFLWASDRGDSVRFIVMKTDDSLGVAVDACELCGPSGYAKEGAGLVCLNCAADLSPASLGRSGGCNPISLRKEIRENKLVVQVEELLRFTHLFGALKVAHAP